MKPSQKPSHLLALTLVNLALLCYQLARLPRAVADEPPGILRGRGLEIVDDQGRVRGQWKVEPADPTYTMPDGTKGYPETVILRLVTADGKPRVKLTTSADGSSLMLLGDSDDTQTTLHAQGERSSLLLRSTAEQRRVLVP